MGLGIAASVTSNKVHRGDHRIFACVMTNDKVISTSRFLEKESEYSNVVQRHLDGDMADMIGMTLLHHVIGGFMEMSPNLIVKDATELAKERFLKRPFFAANGQRFETMPKGKYALLSGAFNPPHEGHFGVAQQAMDEYNYRAVFEITVDPPHKDALTVQAMLERSQMLRGHDRLFNTGLPLYLDKAKRYPKTPLILGADAMLRMLDPKWGLNVGEMFGAFYELGTKLLINGREIDGNFVTCDDILDNIKANHPFKDWASARIIMKPLSGVWNISSTELRNKSL